MSARRTHRFRAAAVSTAGVLAFAGLAGCNGSGEAATELDSLTPVAAIQKVADAASKDSAAYTFEVTGSGVSVRGSGAYRGGDQPAARMVFDSMKMLGFSVPAGTEFRLVDDLMYLKVTKDGLIPGLGGGADGEGGWVSLPLDEATSEGADITGIDPTMANPVESLEKMLDTDDVTKVGTETVDGVKTTHYRAKIAPEGTGTVTEKKSSTHSNELSRQLEEQLENSIRSSMGLSEPVTVDAWVDGDYRARKLAVTLPMFGEVKMTMKFTDFGSDVKVDVPAGAEPLDTDAVLEEALGGELSGALGDDFSTQFGEQFGEDFSKQLSEQLEQSLGENFSSDLSERFAEQLREHMERTDSGAGRVS